MSVKTICAAICALSLAVAAAADTGTVGANSGNLAPASSIESAAQASLLPALPSSEAGSRVITFDEAISAAMAGNDDLAIAAGNLAAAKATHEANLAKNEPSLSANGQAGITDGFTDQTMAKATGASGLGLGESFTGGLSFGIGTANATSGTRIGISATQTVPVSPQISASGSGSVAVPQTTVVAATISQTVWDGYVGGQTQALVDQSILTLKGKELAARQARSAASTKVKQAYITALVAQRTLALRLGILDKLNSLYKQLQATYAIKQASAIDLQTAEINAKSAGLDVETSRHDYSLARQRLALLIGLAPDANYRVAEIDVPKLPAASLDDAIAQGLAKRADIAQYDIAQRSALISAAVAGGSAQPSLLATGGIGVGLNWGASADPSQSVKSVDATTGQSISLGLKLGLPILDSGAAKAAEDAAKATARVAATQAAQLRKSVAADIRDAWWNLQILAERSDLAAQSVDLAESQFALMQAQVKFGTATNQDMLTASVNAANAEVAWLTAKSNQLLAELTLETAMGL
ncbi:MAG TPA: TolC family protein [Rectinemataceae bacterium]|nr:TolC family protein [Rectinemataceae bacterium]